MNVPILGLLRPHQYVKNGFALVGLLFAEQRDVDLFVDAIIGFLAFCAAASAVYILNDIFDCEADRRHAVKRKRSIASGAVSIKTAWVIAGLLAFTAMSLAAVLSEVAVILIVLYGLMNVGYSMRWKHVVVVDVFIIATGFMLRILIGTIGIGIPPSSWLLLCGAMLALFLGFSKRRAELKSLEQGRERARVVLDDYSVAMTEQFMSISAACVILCYSIYTVSPETVERHHTTALITTVPFVVYGVFRYLYLLHRKDKGEDTARDLYADTHMLSTVGAWILVTLIILAQTS